MEKKIESLGYKYLDTKDINGNKLYIKQPDNILCPKDEKDELLHVIGIFDIKLRKSLYMQYDNKTGKSNWNDRLCDVDNNKISFFKDLKSAKMFLKSLEFNDVLLKKYRKTGYVFIESFYLYDIDVLIFHRRQKFSIYFDDKTEMIRFKKI